MKLIIIKLNAFNNLNKLNLFKRGIIYVYDEDKIINGEKFLIINDKIIMIYLN